MSRSLWLACCLLGIVANLRAQDVAAGDAALAKFDLDAALSAYRAAHARSPDDYEATWKLAQALADKSTLSKDRAEQKQCCIVSEQLARSAIALKPDDSKGHTRLAVAVGKLALYEGGKRKVELAIEVKMEAQKAIQLNDQEHVAYHVLGVWNREMAQLNWVMRRFAEFLYGKFPSASLDDARHHLDQASVIAPNVVSHRVELGVTLADAREWAAASDALEKSLAMQQTWVTDDYYWSIARQNLKRVKAHLK